MQTEVVADKLEGSPEDGVLLSHDSFKRTLACQLMLGLRDYRRTPRSHRALDPLDCTIGVRVSSAR